MGSKNVTLLLYIVKETEKAFLVSENEEDQKTNAVWIPKSQIKHEELAEPGDTIYFDIPEWLAIAKEFV